MFFVMQMLVLGVNEKTGLLFAREVQKSIADSVFSLCKALIEIHDLPYICTKNSITGLNGTKTAFVGISGVTEQSVKSLYGFKYCFVEEAQALSQSSWDILEPTLREDGNQFFFAMNRLKIKDPVYNYCVNVNPENTLHVNIQYYDNPWITDQQVNDILAMKKKDYNKYLHIYLGHPIEDLDRSVFTLSEINNAYKRNIENPTGGKEWGVDVARFGDDKTVIVSRKGYKQLSCVEFSKLSVVEVADMVMSMAEKNELIKVDDTGVGGGVTDILRDRGYYIEAVNFGSKAEDEDKYPNVISEMWFELKEYINEIQLMEDYQLTEELVYRQWDMTKDGRRIIEPKKKFKEEYGRSPDKGDAVLLAFYNAKVRCWDNLVD